MSWFSKFLKKEPLPKTAPEGCVRLDFVKTFPHVIWVSTVTCDRDGPDGFHCKMFATRHEPEMMIDLMLLREMEDGSKRTVFHMQAPVDKLSATDDLMREIEKDKNVEFERFDLHDIRTFDEFKNRAVALGWETAHGE